MIYYVPTKIHFGNEDFIDNLNSIVKSYLPKKIFLITGRNFVKRTGLSDIILKTLNNYEVLTYNSVNPSPQFNEIYHVLTRSEAFHPNLIIGIGGGSVLDTGKIVSIMTNNGKPILSYINNQERAKSKIPFIAIPTTAGTGSEVTPFAAFYHNKKKQSFGSIGNYLVYPDHAIVNPELTLTMPKEITASSGLDALSQALESYWSINSNPLSDTHAIEAMRLILCNLTGAYRDNDVECRFNMSKASLEAGLAFSQTATTAPHSVSYPMTAHFNLSHGFACALTLPEFLLYNFNVSKEDCLDKRGYQFVKNKLENIAIPLGDDFLYFEKLYREIKFLMRDINAPLTLHEAGIDDIEIILNEGFSPERMNNNPRKVTRESLQEILEKIK